MVTAYETFEYNSQDSFDSDDDDTYSETAESELEDEAPTKPRECTEHSNQMSYSWRLITLCILKVALNGMMNFLSAAGLEMSGI